MNAMKQKYTEVGSSSSVSPPTERMNTNNVDHPPQLSKNLSRRKNSPHPHRRCYNSIMLNRNSNIILISAAIVLLLTSTCSPTTNTSHRGIQWLAHAFVPSHASPFRQTTSLLRPKWSSSPSASSLSPSSSTSSRITIQLLPLFQPILSSNSSRRTILHATTDKNKSKPSSSWSKAAMATDTDTSEPPTTRRRPDSRIGVRRRVKSVLKKARRRTGIRNNSDEEEEEDAVSTNNGTQLRDISIPSVVADAAAMGGLGDGEIAFDWAVSTVSTPSNQPQPCPDESLVVATPTNTTTVSASTSTKSPPPKTPQCTEMDVFKSDVSAAFSLPPTPLQPLPFSLPKLDADQKSLLQSGERVQFQSEMGREGSGFVVLDVAAPESVVWNCLLDFKSYPQTIPTVQKVFMEDDERGINGAGGNLDYGTSGTSRAAFTLSRKFKLKVSVVHDYHTHPMGDYLIFTLDKRSQNFVLNKAKGVWYTESEGEGLEPGKTRVWLLAELKVSRILPRMIVDYAAKKAMPRATNWIKPHVEAAASLWLKPDKI